MVVAEGLCGDTQITAEGPHYADFCTIETELFRTRVRLPPAPPEEPLTAGQPIAEVARTHTPATV